MFPTDTRSGTPYTYTYNGLAQLVVRALTNAGPDLTHLVHDRFGKVIAPTFGAIRFWVTGPKTTASVPA